MKQLILWSLMAIGFCASAQNVTNLNEQQAEGTDNIQVQALSHDSLSSSFLIWVKEGVMPHIHAEHTEQVLILEGTGMMQLGDQIKMIQPMDFITIPAGVPHSVQVTSQVPLKVLSIQSPYFDGTDRIMLNR